MSDDTKQSQLRELAKLALARKDDALIRTAAQKVAAGKPLTKREESALQLAAQGSDPTEAVSYAGTWDELATALGVSRRALQDWRSDPRYRDDLEKRKALLERADGRHCVAEWLRFMADHHLKRGAAAHVENDPESAGDEEGEGSILRPPRVGGRMSEWEVAIAALDHRKKENAVRVQEGSLLVAADLEVLLGATFATIQTKLAQFPARVARYLVGLVDVSEVEDKLRDELDADLGDLHAAGYTAEDAVAVAVAAVPFDTESARLFALVTFDGQDRAALLQLITAVATEALRQLGRRVITKATGEDSSATAASHPAPETSPASSESSSADAAPPPAPPASAGGKKAASKAKASGGEKAKPTTRKARPKTATAPPEVEAAIAPAARRRVTRRRKG